MVCNVFFEENEPLIPKKFVKLFAETTALRMACFVAKRAEAGKNRFSGKEFPA